MRFDHFGLYITFQYSLKEVQVSNKISHQYENSPYYIGTKLWNDLPVNIQKAENVFVFKKHIKELYKTFRLHGEQV